MYFNPRSPCGERLAYSRLCSDLQYFNPRSPCGERPLSDEWIREDKTFQSTLPVWGATTLPARGIGYKPSFQSTLPVWGATGVPGAETGGFCFDFNPRSPCGERRVRHGRWIVSEIFQSTLPVWGATKVTSIMRAELIFQSTHPVWGATMDRLRHPNTCRFQSTLPVWGATAGASFIQDCPKISIHAPRVGSD